MSYVNKGSMAATITVSHEPDRSGNYICNGTADEVEINAALNYVNTQFGGGEVLIKQGTYTLTSDIILVDNVTLRGVGFATILYITADDHCIYTASKDNIIIQDLKILGNNTQYNGTNHGIYVYGSENIIIENIKLQHLYNGITTASSQQVDILKCNIYDIRLVGIYLNPLTEEVLIGFNQIENTGSAGIQVYGANFVTVKGNKVYDWSTIAGNAGGIQIKNRDATYGVTTVAVVGNVLRMAASVNNPHGILVSGESSDATNTENVVVEGNTIYGQVGDGGIGIYLHAAVGGIRNVLNISVGDNTIVNAHSGIVCAGPKYVTMVGNTILTPDLHGIQGATLQDSTIIGNTIIDYNESAGVGGGIFLDDTCLNITIDGNRVEGPRYGIETAGSTDYIIFGKNDLRGNTSAPILLGGVDTNNRFPSKTFQFIKELNGDYRTASPTGIEINATTEAAVLQGHIPLDVQQVIRLRLFAVAGGAPIGAGGQMHLEVTFNAGAVNAAYNTAAKSWSLTNFDGEEADYVADDVVTWLIEDGDVGNELLNLATLDKFELIVIYESGADPDGATNAVFGSISVEYV